MRREQIEKLAERVPDPEGNRVFILWPGREEETRAAMEAWRRDHGKEPKSIKVELAERLDT